MGPCGGVKMEGTHTYTDTPAFVFSKVWSYVGF